MLSNMLVMESLPLIFELHNAFSYLGLFVNSNYVGLMGPVELQKGRNKCLMVFSSYFMIYLFIWYRIQKLWLTTGFLLYCLFSLSHWLQISLKHSAHEMMLTEIRWICGTSWFFALMYPQTIISFDFFLFISNVQMSMASCESPSDQGTEMEEVKLFIHYLGF